MLESNMGKKVSRRAGAAAAPATSQQSSLPLLFQWQVEQMGFSEAWIGDWICTHNLIQY